MKTALLLYVGSLITVILVGIISVLTMKSSYADTIRTSLDDSIVYSVKMLQQDRKELGYGIESGAISWDNMSSLSDFKKNFVSYLVAGLDNRITDLDVRIYGADESVGALSIEVTAYFTYPTGQSDSVSSYKTVILNKYIKPND